MNRIHKFRVILDADDVLLDCNRYALALLSQKDGVPYDIEHVTAWGYLGIPEDRRLEFLNSADFYRNQPALPGAAEFLAQLMKKADVTIMTAVYPQFMGERIRRISELFPDFPMENIIMGHRKEMLRADVMLDDGVHNITSSMADLPVLFRQPWNRSVSGICSVNYYNEFLSLVDIMIGKKQSESRLPKVVCIVGPSGSGKHELTKALCEDPEFEHILTHSTCASAHEESHMSEAEFEEAARAGYFMETTYYCSARYGLAKEDIDKALSCGSNAAAVMDISGCMAVHNHYPGQCLIVYVDTEKKDCIRSVLSKDGLDISQRTDRILSFDYEEKNKILADVIVRPDPDGSFTKAIRKIKKHII